MAAVIQQLGGALQRVLIHDLVANPEGGGTFYGLLVFDQGGRSIEVDCRPSDGVALAVRMACPIYVADHLLDAAE